MEKHISKYLFGSRIITHVLFWGIYYLTFSLLWSNDGNYHKSFSLEFILMPIRIGASYLTIYLLMPKYLLNKKLLKFGIALSLLLIVSGVLQRFFTFYFYEIFFSNQSIDLWDLKHIVRSMVLINTTVLLLFAMKMFDYWQIENNLNVMRGDPLLEVRSEKRNYRIKTSDIYYIEGLGNYVTFYMKARKPMISYITLKELEKQLPEHFIRTHKSFIVNKNHIESYTSENLEAGNRLIPVGKTVQLDF
ncbi:MAG: LytTR family transcriptional regulator [Reichenbachiella sp.]